jgi:hypothetical protein
MLSAEFSTPSTIVTDRVISDGTTAGLVAATAVAVWVALVNLVFQQNMALTTLLTIAVIAYVVCIVGAQWTAALVRVVRQAPSMIGRLLFIGVAAGAALWSLLAWRAQTMSPAVAVELAGGMLAALLTLFVWLAPTDEASAELPAQDYEGASSSVGAYVPKLQS